MSAAPKTIKDSNSLGGRLSSVSIEKFWKICFSPTG